MPKRLCACGCGVQVTHKIESQHMNALAPTVLASQVLDQNRKLIQRKKKSQAVGFPAPFRRRLAMQMDPHNNDPALDSPMIMGEDFHEVRGQPSHSSALFSPTVEQSKFLKDIN
jgi:hypothetical protein